MARELRIPEPSSNERGRTAASPKPVSTGGLGRCRRVTAPSPEEAAAKQPVLGGPLEPILEEAEEKSLEGVCHGGRLLPDEHVSHQQNVR